MRVLKFAFASVAALIIFSGSAYAIEVNKKIAAPGGPEDIWEMISDFCSIQDWHPAVEQCDESEEGGDTYRVLTLKGGGKIKEKLVDHDDESYTYQIIESPLPVKNYQAKIWVEEDARQPDRTDDPLGCDVRCERGKRRGRRQDDRRHLHRRPEEHQAHGLGLRGRPRGQGLGSQNGGCEGGSAGLA